MTKEEIKKYLESKSLSDLESLSDKDFWDTFKEIRKRRREQQGMEAVEAYEKDKDKEQKVTDVSDNRELGHDILSENPNSKETYYIEVKGLWHDCKYALLPPKEVKCGKEKKDNFILAVVLLEYEKKHSITYYSGMDFEVIDTFERMGGRSKICLDWLKDYEIEKVDF